MNPAFVANMPIDDYIADPCPTPSMDSRTAIALRDRSPLHARHQHPRFNHEIVDEYSRRMDIGTAFHSLILEGKRIHGLAPFDNYKSKKARDFREAAAAEGKVLLLNPDYDKFNDMVAAFNAQGGYDILGTVGTPELSGFFTIDGAWCRTRPDWTDDSRTLVRFTSLKTVTGDASRGVVERRFFRDGWDVAAALNSWAAAAIWSRDCTVSWLLVEQDPPHAISLHEFNKAALTFAGNLIRRLALRWSKCLETGDFPGYYDPKERAEVTYRKFDLDRIRLMAGARDDD